METVPRLVYLIYEELLQPLPPQLAGMASPGSDVPSNMPPSNVSISSDHSSVYNSVRPASLRSSTRNQKSIKPFSSFNLGTQRQISIPGKAANKKKVSLQNNIISNLYISCYLYVKQRLNVTYLDQLTSTSIFLILL